MTVHSSSYQQRVQKQAHMTLQPAAAVSNACRHKQENSDATNKLG
jgi:hypothetical protein